MTVKFDWNKFRITEYEARTAEIELKNLGGEPENNVVWKVKSLDAAEMAKVREAVEKNRDMSGLLSMISDEMSGKEKLTAVSDLLGVIRDKTPDQLVRQYVVFELGTVDPMPESRADVIKFARAFPVEFNQICTKIFELTGMGSVAKKKLNISSEEMTPEAI